MSTMYEVDYKCPICGKKFGYMTQFSYSIFGCNLDFKPFGAAAIPTPLPKCTKCNFVFFDETFDENEIKLLKNILRENNIFKLEPDMPNYYYLAKEYELLGKDINKIIDCYLSAIWEEGNGSYRTEENMIFTSIILENGNWNIFEKIAKILMEYIDKIDKDNDQYYKYQLIKLDCLRRLKMFFEARDLIILLCNDKDFPKNEYLKVLDCQFELMKNNDIAEHKMPDNGKENKQSKAEEISAKAKKANQENIIMDSHDFEMIGTLLEKYRGNAASVTIPAGVIIIGDRAFCGCKNITAITIPEGVTAIGEGAFFDCTGLSSITIPASVTAIGYGAFFDCIGLTAIMVDKGNPHYASEGGILCNKAKTELLAFPSASGNVTLPEGLSAIGDSVFRNRESLTGINIPKGVTAIGNKAFEDCKNLTSVTIPAGVASIGDYAFSGCENITAIALPEGVTVIGDSAFIFCTGLTGITLPASLTTIGDSAFYNCTGLTSIIIPKGVTVIDASAFDDCTGLTSIIIPEGVTEIGIWAFENCTGLSSITIPASVTDIGMAFTGWTAKQTINIQGHASQAASDVAWDTPCGDNWRKYCKAKINYLGKLTKKDENKNQGFKMDGKALEKYKGNAASVTIPEGVTSIKEYAFKDCKSLTSIIIPASVTSIGYHAFNGCTNLTSISIPEGVTEIGSYPFYGCKSLANVTIPASVKFIDLDAFTHCTSLTSVTFAAGGHPLVFPLSPTADSLKNAYLEGGAGTYMRGSGGRKWTKQ